MRLSLNNSWFVGLLAAGLAGGIVAAARAQVTVLQPGQPDAENAVGVEERLGQVLPADLTFSDENQVQHTLGELIDRPTLLILVFYRCPGTCPMILGSTAGVLDKTTFQFGKDFQVLTVSFDDEDTAEMAQRTGSNYMGLVKSGVPDKAWRFLTGDADTIQKLCTAVGFKVLKRDSHVFVHPNLVTVLSRDRKVIRYLYGTEYLPMDVGMALSEAARGTPGVSIKKMMSYCFKYDAKNRRYAFSALRVYGTTTLVALGLFLFFLLRKRKEDPPGSGTP